MLCIFNPEHDLCLANGNAHFVPPASALRFAEEEAHLMEVIYPGAEAVPAARAAANGTARDIIVPWGWNRVVKTQLISQGFSESLMPTDEALERWRQLQHRSTVLPLQPDCCAAVSEAEVDRMIARHDAVVMKAPWSGAGRGLRWATGRLTEQDRLWIAKVVRTQRCVVVEPRRRVGLTFALEYQLDAAGARLVGHSLFDSANGVYQGNLLLPDDEIARQSGFSRRQREALELWLSDHIAPFYQGPAGVDYILDTDGAHHLTELNLRHTMGLVAHEYLRQHPSAAGTRWRP